MSKFKNRAEFEEWAFEQFSKYGIRQPDTYGQEELVELNPGVPVEFIHNHINEREIAIK
jgi:hypothetical protein